MFDVNSTPSARARGNRDSFAASVQRRGGRAERRQAHDRFQRQPSLVRSDGRALGGQSDDPGDLPRHLRSACRAEARPVLHARSSDRLGMERRQVEGLDGCARGRRLARRVALHAGRRCLVARARRRPEDRQSDPVRLGHDRQFQDRRPSGHGGRQAVRPGAVQMDGVSHRLHPAEGALHQGRRRGLRKEAGRRWPVHGRRVSGQFVPAAQAQRQILG